MKKIFRNFMAVAIAAMTFTACEDVPAPYDVFDEEQTNTSVTVEPQGTGTQADPFNVAAAIAKAKEIGSEANNDKYYVKGICVVSGAADATYGNASFYIADNTDGDRFYCFQVLGTGGKKMAAGYTINEGDEVVIYGPIYNYRGNTPETAGKGAAQIVTVNGKSTDDNSGTSEPVDAKTVTIAEFNAAAESDAVWYQLTGTVKNLKDGDKFGNFDLEDATGSVYVYGLLAEKGGEKQKFQELAAAKGIKNGSKLTLIGTRGSYNDKIEVMNAYFVSVEGGSDTPATPTDGEGKGTADSPYNVTAAMSAGSGTGVYVKGFIVGSIDGKSLASDTKFSAATSTATNIIIAASADETSVDKCMPIQLPTGAVRSALNLVDNAGNYKKEVVLYGNIETYFGAIGLKSVTFAILDGNEIGTNPGGGNTTPDTPSGDVKAVSVADFNAAAESNDVWYQLTGTVKNLKDGDQYGNFDLEDATGSVYVYGLLSEKGGEKKKFQDLVAAKGIKEGSKITIIGNRGSYNGKIEVMNAYFVSIEGDDTPAGDGVKAISVADFNAAAESTDVWYQLTGTISNLKDGDQYGNFDLTDATGSVYVYGVLATKGGEKKKFQDLVSAYGIKNGSTITIIGNRGSYNGKIEVLNAYFVKVE